MCIIRDMKTLALHRFGQQIKTARQRRGLTQAAVAERAGLPRVKVIQAEKGVSTVSIGAYALIGAALGVELTLVPSRRPTLEEARLLFADE